MAEKEIGTDAADAAATAGAVGEMPALDSDYHEGAVAQDICARLRNRAYAQRPDVNMAVRANAAKYIETLQARIRELEAERDNLLEGARAFVQSEAATERGHDATAMVLFAAAGDKLRGAVQVAQRAGSEAAVASPTGGPTNG